MREHAAMRELAAGAALGDLDPIEREQFEAHLATCAACRSLTVDLGATLADLALLAPAEDLPPAMRAHALGAIAGPMSPVTGASGLLPRSLRRPPDAQLRLGAAAAFRWAAVAMAAVLAIAVIGLAADVQRLGTEVATAREELAAARAALQARQAVIAVAADPRHVTVALHAEPLAPDAEAVVLFRAGTAEAYLVATDLPPTPSDRVYQLWVADGSGVHPLATFSHDGQGPFVAPFGTDLSGAVAAMVTLEPVGGAMGDPGPQVVFGEF